MTIRTARSRSSAGYLFDVLPDMTPTFPTNGVSGLAGAVQIELLLDMLDVARDRDDPCADISEF